MCFCWAHMSVCWFCNEAAQIKVLISEKFKFSVVKLSYMILSIKLSKNSEIIWDYFMVGKHLVESILVRVR